MKNNKKKILLIALLLFVVVGFASYGAYSYYYTQGSFDTVRASDESSDNVIRITGSFNPTMDGYSSGSSGSGSSGSAFLGNGGTIYLDCPEKSGGHDTITCTATLSVYNSGSTSIYVSYYDTSFSASSSDADVSISSSSMGWGSNEGGSSETYISSGSSSTLYISVDVNIGNSTNVSYNEPQLVTDPVLGGSLTVYASLTLSATQYHY